MGYEDGRLAMRIDVPWVISILGGMLIGGLLVLALSGLPKRASRPNPPPVTQEMPAKASPVSPTPTGPARAGAASSPNRQATVKPGNANVRRTVAAGRLREAQEEYLTVLLQSPGDQKAMAGLIAVQRQLAKDDPVALRRQAAVFQNAIARGAETEEHYTANAMMILMEAKLLAALEIERERGIASGPAATSAPISLSTAGPDAASVQPAPPNPTPRPARTRRRPTPPAPRVAATPAPVVRPPTAAPATVAPLPATPAPQASLDVNEAFFIVLIGPIYDATRASEIAAELTLAGYAAKVSRPAGGSSYMITLGPYRRSVVDAIVKTITARYGRALPVAVSPVP